MQLYSGIYHGNPVAEHHPEHAPGYFGKINRLPLRYFDSTSTGDVLSRVTNDVDTVGQTMNQSFSTLVSAVATLFGSMIMMFVTNWIMAFFGIAAALIGFAMMMAVIGKSQKNYSEQQKELGGLNGHVEETYGGHTVIKAYNGEAGAKNIPSLL